jgi:hypothetical protein
LGLPTDELLSHKGPHLLLCAALLAAPSALTWVFHKAAAAAAALICTSSSSNSSDGGGGTAGALATTLGRQTEAVEGAAVTGQGVLWLMMSYSVLPLVWAGEQDLIADNWSFPGGGGVHVAFKHVRHDFSGIANQERAPATVSVGERLNQGTA